MRASAAAGRAGIPSVSIIASSFNNAAQAVAKGLGVPQLKIAHYPGLPMTDSPETARSKARALLPEIIAGLTSALGQTDTAVEKEPAARDVVFRGTLDDVNEYFHEQSWTDGMAIIPPSGGRVGGFLGFTGPATHE